MRTRRRYITAVVVAAAVLASISGCALHTSDAPQKTAQITVNGNTRTSHTVSCTQVEWALTADIGAGPAHVRAVLGLDPGKPKAESVNIDNFEGFSGLADAGAGHAEATFAGETYHITGTAEQSNAENPEEAHAAPFTIDVTC